MTQFDLTDDQRAIHEMARKFTADAITPHAAEWDEKHIFPSDAIKVAAELGIGAPIRVPPAYHITGANMSVIPTMW